MITPNLKNSDNMRYNIPWIPIRGSFISQDQRGWKLDIGDKIKIGRQMMKLLEVRTEKPNDRLLFPYAYVFLLLTYSKRIS